MEIQERMRVSHPAFDGKTESLGLFNSEPLAVACADIDGLLQKGDTCVLVTGEAGIGKSTILDKLHPILDRCLVTARVSASLPTAGEFLAAALKSFGFDAFDGHPEEYRHILRAFVRHEATHSNKPVLIVDDAQDIKPEVLFELNSLVGMRINGAKAINLLLVGRPEAEQTLNSTELAGVWQSITVRSQIKGLCEVETAGYIDHRLNLRHVGDSDLFPAVTLPSIYRYTGGVPGLINLLCSACLKIAANNGLRQVSQSVVKTAVSQLQLTPRAVRSENDRNKKLIAAAAVGKDKVPRVVLSHEGRLLGVYTLDKERVSIGRHHFNEICIDSSAISRHHAQLLVNGKGVYLIDLNSTNGTFVNFKLVEQKLLKNSDIIAVGKHRLKFTEARNTRPSNEVDTTPVPQETVVIAPHDAEQDRPPIKRVK